MGQFFANLLAQPIPADHLHEVRLARALQDCLATPNGDVPGLLADRLDDVRQPSDPLLMRIAQALEQTLSANQQQAVWADLRARYPAHPLAAMLDLRAILTAAQATSPDGPDESDGPDLDVRERYSELLEHYAENPPALAELHELGQTIARLEKRGVLPRVMVLRGAWRRPD